MVARTISHYQILEKLGEGGMGVAYKARDTHLDRFVAIKVLAAEKVADPERKRRFVQEAKAASALNHPNIITIHDIDQAEGIDFISMEFLAGKTLDRLIPRHGMRLNDALKCAVQIADALARAHSAGIIHRDLKPGNIMVDEHGLVKVLDFGLAKLTEVVVGQALPPPEDDATRTMRPVTEEGKIVGTVAYMSPEQAEGKPVDARSDIFSFGSVLYEMVTGQRAFQGDTKMSTLAAIIHREPEPLSPTIPHDLEKVITRCLRKDSSRRFQHMDDVKIALQELKEESDSGTLSGAPQPVRTRLRTIVWAGALVVVAALAVGAWFLTRQHPRSQPVVAPLTTYPGEERCPSFSPDGSQVAFSWDGPKQDNWDIYVKLIGAEKPLRLTTDPAAETGPAWSPDGRSVAFVRVLFRGQSGVFLIPAIGGPERKLVEFRSRRESNLAWSPDGNWLAFTDRDSVNPAGESSSLYALSIETGERRRLTSPPPHAWDGAAAFSPDGRNLVFCRVGPHAFGELHLLELSGDLRPTGEPKQITLQRRIAHNPAWTLDGREIVYVSFSETSSELWRVPASGSAAPQRVELSGDRAESLAISRQGNRLVWQRRLVDLNIWRLGPQGPGGRSGNAVNLISSTWDDDSVQYSPDGNRITFISGRSGHREVWVCGSDGSNPVQLTSLRTHSGAPRWSPDGKRIVFDSTAEGDFDVYVIDAGGGRLIRLTNHPADDAVASFSTDGRWIYFTSSRTGRFELWKMPAEGGEAVQVTRNGGHIGLESPDGKHLYYTKSRFEDSLWRLPVGGGEEEKILEPVIGASLAVTARGIYFARPRQPQGGNPIEFRDFSTGKTTTIATTPAPIFWCLSVSPDERYLLYTQGDQIGSDLMLVENFR